jgi:hypothetical protein
VAVTKDEILIGGGFFRDEDVKMSYVCVDDTATDVALFLSNP